jgi:hypothetical protein
VEADKIKKELNTLYDAATIVELDSPRRWSNHNPLVVRVRHSPTREGRVFVLWCYTVLYKHKDT